MLLLVIILFLVCWGPRLLFNVCVKLGLQTFTNTTYTIRVASYLLSAIHSALNPFVYGLMSSTFRSIVFKSCMGRNRTNGPESCGMSGRIVAGSKIASGTWAVDEMVEDDATDIKVGVTDAKKRLLDTSANVQQQPLKGGQQSMLRNPSKLHQRTPASDVRERSSSQSTVLTVAP